MSDLFPERGGVPAAASDRAWLQGMLDAESALARARGIEGADAIAAVCVAERFDLVSLGMASQESGNPVVPLAKALREVSGVDEAHRGATSQDILDTATMLVVRRALEPLLGDFDAASVAAARLASEHRSTPMPARTLLQQALPTTFGLVAGQWLTALDGAAAALRALELPAQLGGPAGTLVGLGPEVAARFAAELGLAEPVLPWHTDRRPVAAVAGALGAAAGVVAKVARDVTLLSQTEVGEVREAAPGGSSAMPHKRNPVAAITALGAARQAPGLVSTLLASMEQEHQRAAGGWHAEWRPLRELLIACGTAAAWLRACLEGLQVDAERMRANLELGVPAEERGGEALARHVAAAETLVDRALSPRRP
jgi:3-carboxy-cis,cis-muconate cycloisomerase